MIIYGAFHSGDHPLWKFLSLISSSHPDYLIFQIKLTDSHVLLLQILRREIFERLQPDLQLLPSAPGWIIQGEARTGALISIFRGPPRIGSRT